MNAEEIKVGDSVIFRDEFGERQAGKVITRDAYELNQFGDGPHFGLNTRNGFGCYVRTADEILAKLE